MPRLKSTAQFEILEQFKDWINDEFVAHCKKEYTEDIFYRFILPHMSDMMENIEAQIGDIAYQSLHDEELTYEDEEFEYGFENS